MVAARRRKGLRVRDILFTPARGTGQYYRAAVLRPPRSLLGTQRDPSAQRVCGRHSLRARACRCDWRTLELVPKVLARRVRGVAPVGARIEHAVLSPRVRDRAGLEVLPCA